MGGVDRRVVGCWVLCVLCCLGVFFLMIRRPPRSTQSRSSAASDVYKRQGSLRKEDSALCMVMAMLRQAKFGILLRVHWRRCVLVL